MNAQTYTAAAAVARMRAGNCPECGGSVESHGNDPRFWMPGNQTCSLLDYGVRERIDWQRELDGAA